MDMIQWKYTVWTSSSDIPCEHDQMTAYQMNMIQWQHTKWTWSTDSIPNDPDPIRAFWMNMICWGHTKWTWSIEDIITEWLWSYEYIHSEDDLIRTYWVNIILWEHTEWTRSDDSIPSEYDEDKPSQHKVCHHAWQNTPDMLRYWKSVIVTVTYTNPLFLHQVWLLLTVYPHTQFGCKNISGTENTGLTNIQSSFEPSLSPCSWTLQCCFFHKIHQLMMMHHQTLLGCKRVSSSQDIAEIIIFWLYESSLWPWCWW